MFTRTIPQNTHDRLSRLFTLLAYATQHAHSRQWIGAILTILAREDARHG